MKRHAHDVAGSACDTPEKCSCNDDVTAVLEASTPIAGRWCLASERDEALAILRELVSSWDGSYEHGCGPIVKRARKLVGGGE